MKKCSLTEENYEKYMMQFKENVAEQSTCIQQTSESTGKHVTATDDDVTWVDRGQNWNGRDKWRH